MTGCAIKEIGMVSALGLDAENACAAARAGLSRLMALEVKNFVEEKKWDGGPVYGHCVPNLGRGFVGKGKVTLLGEHGLRNLMAKVERVGMDTERTGFYLHLSDYGVIAEADCRENDEVSADRTDTNRPAQNAWTLQGAEILNAILRGAGLEVDPTSCNISHGDHTGVFNLIKTACDALLNNEYDSCIVGAVDSKVEPRYLDAAADLLMLRTESYQAGFMPGEAAAFILLQRDSDPLGELNSVRISKLELADEGVSYLDEARPVGVELARVINSVCSLDRSETPEMPGVLIGDLNGWEARSADWGNAVIRLMPDIDVSKVPLWLPAISFGETGAASGVVAIAMAMAAHRRGYAPPGASVIWLASLTGRRGAIKLDSYDC